MPKVRCENIIPAQQIQTAKNLLTAAVCHLLRITKHPSNYVIGHSLPEAYHLGLLESNFDVKRVVPQPFKLFIGTRRYIPDCYFEEKGRPVVVELKPKGTDFEHIARPVSEYLSRKGIEFRMVWNEDVLEHFVLAENWLYMARTLWNARRIDTEAAELEILDRTYDGENCFGDFVQYGDRVNFCENEIAIFRLAYRNMLCLKLSEREINNETEVLPCH